MILSWLKGFNSFTLWSPTRYLVSLLLQALQEIVGFVAIVCYSTLAFAFIKLSIDRGDVVKTILESYFVNVGSFDTNLEDPDLIPFVIFMMATIINLVLMMNMLITILARVVDRVQEKAEVEDLKQKTSMIIGVEKIFRWNREKTDRKVLHMCEESIPEELAQGDVFVKFKSMKKLISELRLSNENFKTKIEEYDGNVNRKIMMVNEKIEAAKIDSISEIKSNSDDLKKLIAEAQNKEAEVQEAEAKTGIEIEIQAKIDDNESSNTEKPSKKSSNNPPENTCIYNHPLKYIGQSPKFQCFLCKNDTCKDKYFCNICNQVYCNELCIDFMKNHSAPKTITKLTCPKEHKLLYFENLFNFHNEMKYSKPVCSLCESPCEQAGFNYYTTIKNKENKEENINKAYDIFKKCKKTIHDHVEENPGSGYHCMLCIYSACYYCASFYDVLKTQRILCTCKSLMTWTFPKVTNNVVCYKAQCKWKKCIKKNSSGFYYCNGCKKVQYCLMSLESFHPDYESKVAAKNPQGGNENKKFKFFN